MGERTIEDIIFDKLNKMDDKLDKLVENAVTKANLEMYMNNFYLTKLFGIRKQHRADMFKWISIGLIVGVPIISFIFDIILHIFKLK